MMGEANVLLVFVLIRHEQIDLDTIADVIATFDRNSKRVKKEIVFTVNTICKISGKSLSLLKRTFSLLKLPEAIDEGGPVAEAPAEPKQKKPKIA
jgi:hypothetical protein